MKKQPQRSKTLALIAAGGISLLLFAVLRSRGASVANSLDVDVRSRTWFGIMIVVPQGMAIDTRDHGIDHQLDVRADVEARYGYPGEQLLTFGYKETAQSMVPFSQWEPCAGCETFQDSLPHGLRLECYRQEASVRDKPYRLIGCRSVVHRIVAMYRCPVDLPARCVELETIRNNAFRSLQPSEEVSDTGAGMAYLQIKSASGGLR